MKIYTDFDLFMKDYGDSHGGSTIYDDAFEIRGFIIVTNRSWCSGHPFHCSGQCGLQTQCKIEYKKIFRKHKLERIINDL